MKYSIDIPNPCSEKWSHMTPTKDGRYCNVCKKEIYDFTKLTNRQLVDKLSKDENICARYRKDQLKIDLYSNENKGFKKFHFLISLTSIFSLSEPVFSQEPFENTNIYQKHINDFSDNQKKQDIVRDSIIKGIVKDKIGPLPGVNVMVKGEKYETETNFDGEFSIEVPEKIENIILVFSYVGMETQEVSIKNNGRNKILNVEMEEDPDQLLMGEVVVTKKHNIFWKIGNMFRHKK